MEQAFVAMNEEEVPIIKCIDSRVLRDLRPKPEKVVKKVVLKNYWDETPLPTEGLEDERVVIFRGSQLKHSSR